MGPAEVVAMIKDIVLATAAASASYVGIRGLKTWQRQLKGTIEYQLAKNILTCVYELRDELKRVRSPVMSHGEPDLPAEKLQNLSRRERDWHGMAQAYQKRWDLIPPLMARLRASVWEAEAVWISGTGKRIAAKTLDLNSKLNELLWAIQGDIEAKNPAHENRPPIPQQLNDKWRQIRFWRHENDEFEKDIDDIITDIEKELHVVIEPLRS
jgi:hypothetical protein